MVAVTKGTTKILVFDFGSFLRVLYKLIIMRESKIEHYLVAQVEKMGGLCVKFPPLFFLGFPDRLVLLPGGTFILVETKAPGKVPSKLQDKVHGRLRRLGFRVEVLPTIQDVNQFIEGL